MTEEEYKTHIEVLEIIIKTQSKLIDILEKREI